MTKWLFIVCFSPLAFKRICSEQIDSIVEYHIPLNGGLISADIRCMLVVHMQGVSIDW